MKHLTLLTVLLATFWASAQDAAKPDRAERLKQFLEKFPEADVNKDGELSREEIATFKENRAAMLDKKKSAQNQKRVEPTHANVAYGDHERQVFDLWTVPDAAEPTALAMYIHGGGFRAGDKSGIRPQVVQKFLDAGVAVASLNYRLSDTGPYPIMMYDGARAVQTIRHRSEEWNLDPKRLACFGGSAGSGISGWLAFHEDLADPKSEDPVARESTRLVAAGLSAAQGTYDMRTFREWLGVPDLKPHDALYAFYGIKEDSELEKPEIQALMEDASPVAHLTRDDPPVYFSYGGANTEVTNETSQGAWVHHVKLGLKVKEAMDELGIECIVRGRDVIPENDPYGSMEDFLIEKLKAGNGAKKSSAKGSDKQEIR